MKSTKMRRNLAFLLLAAMMLTAVFGSTALAYTYGYPNYNYKYDYDYYYDYYQRQGTDGFLSVYPVSGYYGYDSYSYYDRPYYYGNYGYPGYYYYGYGGGDNRAYLGGVNIPKGVRNNIVVNGRSMDWSVLGRSVDLEGNTGVISATAQNSLDFAQSLGRAEDGTLCLIANVTGSGVSLDNQEVMGLYGRIDGLEKMKAEGIESLAVISVDGNLRMTYNLTEVIKYAKAAFKEKGASVSKDTLLLSTMPVANAMPADAGEQLGKQYSSEVFVITDGGTRAVEISSLMSESNAHIIVRADAKGASLIGMQGDDIYKAGAATQIQRNGAYFVTGYLPIGAAFGALKY